VKLFESLEGRQLYAVDLSLSYTLGASTPIITGQFTQATVRFDVVNQGSTSAPITFGVELFLSKDRKFDLDDELVSSTVFFGLNAGKKVFKTEDVSFSKVDPGRYYLIAIMDRGGTYSIKENPYRDVDPSDNALVSRRPDVTIAETQVQNTIAGTSGNDKIGVIASHVPHQLIIGVNGVLKAFDTRSSAKLIVDLGDGNDRFAADVPVTFAMDVKGGNGIDRIVGGSGNDSLDGGGSSDRIFGGAGNDTMIGGGGNDRIFAGDGADIADGGSGNDFFYIRDNIVDVINGGDGTDSAQYDKTDTRTSIETFIA
jgi:Ca2+-binding RTX toxin-like protein